jgi:hypothetical protein
MRLHSPRVTFAGSTHLPQLTISRMLLDAEEGPVVIRARSESCVAYTLRDIWIAFALGFYYHEFMFSQKGMTT